MPLSTSETVITVGIVSGVFLAANVNRIAVVINSPNTNRITISKQGTAVDGAGLRLQPLTPPTILEVAKTGNWFQGQTTAIANVGAETITVLEVIQT